MVSGFNKLITALIVVFAITFVGLLAEIFYVLWRRRRQYQQQTPAAASGDSVVVVEAKERVYLFCWRKQSRIEPNEIPIPVDDESEVDEEEEEKWRELCGPSRVLFTIQEEEEREGIESMESDRCSLVPDEAKTKQPSPDPVAMIQIDDDPTPFGTPCASPPYYTPLPSPAREAAVGCGSSNLSSTIVPTDDDSPVDEASISNDNKTPILALEIRFD